AGPLHVGVVTVGPAAAQRGRCLAVHVAIDQRVHAGTVHLGAGRGVAGVGRRAGHISPRLAGVAAGIASLVAVAEAGIGAVGVAGASERAVHVAAVAVGHVAVVA